MTRQDFVSDVRRPVPKRRHSFFYSSPPDATVKVAGDFNNWQPQEMHYSPERKGFSLVRLLAPGEYQYKLIVNGEWQADPANPEFIYNLHGTINSLLRIS